jgi:hypothetical protein
MKTVGCSFVAMPTPPLRAQRPCSPTPTTAATVSQTVSGHAPTPKLPSPTTGAKKRAGRSNPTSIGGKPGWNFAVFEAVVVGVWGALRGGRDVPAEALVSGGDHA